MAVIEFPWPNKGLSPNARLHWAAKSKLTKKSKADAYHLTVAAGLAGLGLDGPINIRIDFHPPDRRGRDVDNMLSSCKSTLDGMAEAMGVNDRQFQITLRVCDPCKGGKVAIHV